MPRSRKEPPETGAEPTPPRTGAARKWLVHLVAPLAAGAILLGGVLVLGRRARDDLRQAGGHTIAFVDVDCEPPPGLQRREFLEEVQYLANLPDRINLLEPDSQARLVAALSAHPWVAGVKRLEVLAGLHVRADLVYRVPVLVVAMADRTVDRNAVLLPQSASREGLPVLRARVSSPLGGPGQPWGDDVIGGAATIAALLLPHLHDLQMLGCTIDVLQGAFVLRAADTRIIWGRGPGKEVLGEALAEQKLQRLLEGPALAGLEHDLRPAAGVKRRPLND